MEANPPHTARDHDSHHQHPATDPLYRSFSGDRDRDSGELDAANRVRKDIRPFDAELRGSPQHAHLLAHGLALVLDQLTALRGAAKP
jgi:hypothetical protein